MRLLLTGLLLTLSLTLMKPVQAEEQLDAFNEALKVKPHLDRMKTMQALAEASNWRAIIYLYETRTHSYDASKVNWASFKDNKATYHNVAAHDLYRYSLARSQDDTIRIKAVEHWLTNLPQNGPFIIGSTGSINTAGTSFEDKSFAPFAHKAFDLILKQPFADYDEIQKAQSLMRVAILLPDMPWREGEKPEMRQKQMIEVYKKTIEAVQNLDDKTIEFYMASGLIGHLALAGRYDEADHFLNRYIEKAKNKKITRHDWLDLWRASITYYISQNKIEDDKAKRAAKNAELRIQAYERVYPVAEAHNHQLYMGELDFDIVNCKVLIRRFTQWPPTRMSKMTLKPEEVTQLEKAKAHINAFLEANEGHRPARSKLDAINKLLKLPVEAATLTTQQAPTE